MENQISNEKLENIKETWIHYGCAYDHSYASQQHVLHHQAEVDCNHNRPPVLWHTFRGWRWNCTISNWFERLCSVPLDLGIYYAKYRIKIINTLKKKKMWVKSECAYGHSYVSRQQILNHQARMGCNITALPYCPICVLSVVGSVILRKNDLCCRHCVCPRYAVNCLSCRVHLPLLLICVVWSFWLCLPRYVFLSLL